MTDRRLNVPKPRRQVDAFRPAASAAQPQAATPAPRRRDEPDKPRAKRGRTTSAAKRRSTVAPTTIEMVRVHTTLGPDVVEALTNHADSIGATHTEVLAGAFVEHGDGLRAGVEEAELAKYEALGFRPPRSGKPPKGRMGTTFYMSTKARASLDEAAATGRFASRSAFIDALLRKALLDG